MGKMLDLLKSFGAELAVAGLRAWTKLIMAIGVLLIAVTYCHNTERDDMQDRRLERLEEHLVRIESAQP